MIGQKSQFLYRKHKQRETNETLVWSRGDKVSGLEDLQDSEVPVHICYKTQLSKKGLKDY